MVRYLTARELLKDAGLAGSLNNLYVGVDCLSNDPDRLIANNMRRDASLFGDDNFTVLLDTYNDRQNGFFFSINPLGARRDVGLRERPRERLLGTRRLQGCAGRMEGNLSRL